MTLFVRFIRSSHDKTADLSVQRRMHRSISVTICLVGNPQLTPKVLKVGHSTGLTIGRYNGWKPCSSSLWGTILSSRSGAWCQQPRVKYSLCCGINRVWAGNDAVSSDPECYSQLFPKGCWRESDLCVVLPSSFLLYNT
jgi:hypothetical protein